ncbi:hypothetical protein MPDQ_007175 [Monascus purpureus]|uniref:Uncharacterized protein n=1 Tax=Monascus purpureus TaxID=5098 RepID=A0A507QUP8_MONPU|nr:hypothetical protein MPDQ_007175 [Monascus purpureus]BDD63762.1 hypothetical protein MAP00_008625 [Monascus purpureus]
MPLRDKFKRVFGRPSNKSSSNSNGGNTNSNGIKIEYYRRGEVPPSKFRGPFDREHQKRLAAWTFEGAMAARCRTPDIPLSPCTTHPEVMRSPRENTNEPPAVEVDEGAVDPLDQAVPPDSMPVLMDISGDGSGPSDSRPGTGTGSRSSTAVDPDSLSSSLSTLVNNNNSLRVDSITQIKESIRHTSPIVHAASPKFIPPKESPLPFPPKDLSRALDAVRICV